MESSKEKVPTLVAMFLELIAAYNLVLAQLLTALMHEGLVGPRTLRKFLSDAERTYQPILGSEEVGINRVALAGLKEMLFQQGSASAAQIGLRAQGQRGKRRNWWEPNRPIRRRDIRKR